MGIPRRTDADADRNLRLACLASGAAAAVFVTGLTFNLRRWGWQVTDFDQLWFAGRALLNREDPYGAWITADLQYPLYYPLHAVLLTLPLAILPLDIARTALAAVTAFLAGFGLRRLGRWWVLALVSPGWWGASLQGQIAPALAGAAMVPSFGFVLAAKPTVGLALFVSRPSRPALAGILILTLLCFLARPDWAASWLRAIGDTPHIRAPITRPGGVVLLLALLRWRTPEGRLLAAWAALPRTESLYDILPLFLIANSAASAGFLVVCSMLALLGLAFMPPPSPDLAYRTAVNWPVMLTLIYIPALLVVLAPALERGLNRVRSGIRAEP